MFFGGLGCVMQFLPVYITQLGVDHSALTMIYTILPFTVIVIKPLFGNIADHLQKHKAVFLISLIVTGLSYYTILFIPELDLSIAKQIPSILNCYEDNENVAICGSRITECASNGTVHTKMTCNVTCHTNVSAACNSNSTCSIPVDDFVQSSIIYFSENTSTYLTNDTECVSAPVINITDFCSPTSNNPCNIYCKCSNDTAAKDSSIYFNTNFLILFIFMVISYGGAGLSISLGDTIVANMLNEIGADFGYQRVFGTLGWGLLSIIAGQIFNFVSLGLAKTNYSPGYHMLLGFFILDVLVCTQLTVIQQPKPVKIWGNIRRLYTDPSVGVFTSAVFVMGLLTGTLWTFLFIYISEMEETSPLLLGLISGVQCFGGELLFFLFSGRIVKKIGHLHSLSICLVCYGIRYIYYYLIVNPWWILPMEICNGVTFGLFFATMVSFASLKAPPGMTATMQGWLQSVFEGIGVGFGTLVSGLLYNRYGGKLMFLILGIFSLVFSIVYMILVAVINRYGHKRDSLTNSDLELQGSVKNATANGNTSEPEKHTPTTYRSVELTT